MKRKRVSRPDASALAKRVSLNRASDDQHREALITATQNGGITLVLGAGVSISRGIPRWDDLATALWQKVFPGRPAPWEASERTKSPRDVPQLLPIAFELAYRELGEQKFTQVLRESLYANVKYPNDERSFVNSVESLAVVAQVIVNEHKRKQHCRLDAIVTFNADDLLERAVDQVAGSRYRGPIVLAVARSTHFHVAGMPSRPLPIYHIHGFLPSQILGIQPKPGGIYDHMLVFTDAQYWSTSAAAFTFANRIMASALGEGRCVFLGLSMTDINLLRWLALRTLERDRDDTEGRREAPWVSTGFKRALHLQFDRHFWIRPRSDDPHGFLSEFLNLRGVRAVEIKDWAGGSLRKLMTHCFP